MGVRSKLRRWQFSVGVIAPAVVSLGVTAGAVFAFVLWSTSGIDQRELQRETALVSQAIEQLTDEDLAAQQSVTYWDDSVEKLKGPYDHAWLDNNLGTWMYEFYGFDATAVYSDKDALVFSMEQGASPAPALFEANDVFTGMIADLRHDLAEGALERHAAGGEYPRVLDTVSLHGRPAIVSVAPIIPQTDAVTQAPGTEYLHIAVDYLDDAFAQRLSEQYRLEGARFSTKPVSSDSASYPLLDQNGRLVAFLEWQPSRPGIEMLQQTGPALVVAFLVAGILVIVLVDRLWASASALEAERIEARHQANHDPLTGLANRAQFVVKLTQALAERGRSRPYVALLMLDLDRFKQVNDTLGHSAGDDLLCAVGQRLREIVGPNDILARLGGDEFAVIHASREGAPAALAMAHSIIDAVSKPFDVSGSEAFVGTSVGVAVAGKDERDQRELTRRADIALYEAKAAGRNRAILYEETMSEAVHSRHVIEADLREALKGSDQLSVAFQPLFSGRGDGLAGAEALIRWTHPTIGNISPALFVPIAEGAGLIEPLGEFVLRRACRLGSRWPGRRIAVNISPVQLRNPRFPERVLDLLVETGMNARDLELEITESILLDTGGIAAQSLKVLREAGLRIALDDFGTGYSSLNYLKRYPVDCIKIDRSFVALLEPGNPSAAIVQAMVTLAHALNIEVTAEGVETHGQMTILRGMGCNLFQGFLLSPPISESAVETKFRLAAERKAGEAAVA